MATETSEQPATADNAQQIVRRRWGAIVFNIWIGDGNECPYVEDVRSHRRILLPSSLPRKKLYEIRANEIFEAEQTVRDCARMQGISWPVVLSTEIMVEKTLELHCKRILRNGQPVI